ncbi:MAG: ABC transporter permease [Deltaproteobacteria bacterium]|nr:ABC transporter permease [Deltaproteobacteria bacterium]
MNKLKIFFNLPLRKGPFRLVTAIAVGGVALAVMVLLVTQSVVQGVEKSFYKALLGFNAHLVVFNPLTWQSDPDLADQIAAHLGDSLQATTPYLYLEGILAHQGKKKGVSIKGVESKTFHQVYDVNIFSHLTPPKLSSVPAIFNATDGSRPVILGSKLARELGIQEPGQSLKIFLPQKDTKLKLNAFRSLTVVGFFESGYYEYDANVALMPLATLQNMVGVQDKITGIEMKLRDPMQSMQFAKKLEEDLGSSYRVLSWMQLNGELFSALRLEKKVFFFIMGALVLIACFNILGVLVLMIHERKREISILRALGLNMRRVKNIFGWIGVYLGLFGLVFGFIFAGIVLFSLKHWLVLPVSAEVYMVDKIPVAFSYAMALLVVGWTLLLAYFAGRLALFRLKNLRVEF